MNAPLAPVPHALSEKNWQYYGVAARLVLAVIVILGFLGLFWAAVSSHDTESAARFGWLLAPAVWLLSSAHRKWKTIPVSDRIAPELKPGRVVNRIALGVLLATIFGAALGILIPLRQRQARSRRLVEMFKQAQSNIPAATQNRLTLNAIIARDPRNFADFQTQCRDLQTALNENDALAIKKKKFWEQISREGIDDPHLLSLIELYKQMGDEDVKATSVLRTMISCADTLAQSDVHQQNKFMPLCIEPAQSQLLLSAANANKLIKQAQEQGAKLPSDIVESVK